MKRTLKFLHELASIGLLGALAANVVLIVTARHMSLVEYASIRQGIFNISRWLLMPSLVLCIITGLLALAATPAFHNAGWVWFKALLSIVMLEGTLGAVQGTARDIAELSARAVNGQPDSVAMADALRHEWGGVWLITALSVLNVAVSVWKPRFSRR